MGILIRRSPIVILLCLELMLNAGNLALVAFSRMVGNSDGQIFAIVVMVVAACEVVVGLGLIVAIFRRKLPLDVDELRELQGMSATSWGWLVLLFPLLGSIVDRARLPGAADPRRRRDRDRRDRPRLRLRGRDADLPARRRPRGPPPRVLALGLRQRRRPRHQARDLRRPALGLHGPRRHRRLDPDPPLLVRVHAVRRGLPALLQLPQLLRLLDAAAGPRRQLRPPDRRLGVRRVRLLRADQLLVPAADGDQGRDEGVRDQRRRRHRARPRRVPDLPRTRDLRLPAKSSPRRRKCSAPTSGR